MIKYKSVTDKEIEIEQFFNQPVVYLDNWALNIFSMDNSFKERFLVTLNKLGGTLALSDVNLTEIVNRQDSGQISVISEFVDSVDAGFIDVNITRVIEKERNSSNGPCADLNLLKNYFLFAHDPLKPFKISEAIFALREEIQSNNSFLQINFEKEIFPLIECARKDSHVLLEAKNRFKIYKNDSSQIKFPCTRHLYTQCIDFIMINEKMTMPDGEWRDVCHTIVPVTYCNFVMLDSRWAHFIKQTGLNSPKIARVYNQNEIELFLKDLENYGKELVA